MNATAPILSDLGAAALTYAARGWHVFPCAPGTKIPLQGHGHLDATTDPQTVQHWWEATPDANIGVYLAASGLLAVDPDIYKPDCDWHNFIQGRDLPATLVAATPSGGWHYVFRADPGVDYAGGPCAGVETKHKGYILVEPSRFKGKQYRWETDDDPAPCPAWVPHARGKATSFENDMGLHKNNTDRLVELLAGIQAHDNSRDLTASLIQMGVPASAVKQIATAALLHGLEPGTRRNDRIGALDRIIEGAVQKFAPVIVPKAERASRFYCAADLKDKPVPPRLSLVPDLIPHKNVTLFGGDGGTGKSLLALQLAIAVATGSNWLGRPVMQGRVIFISAEDDDDELHRRTDDIRRASGLSYDDISSLTLRSLAGEDALLAVETQVALIQSALFEELDALAAQDNPVLIVIDTLADVFPSNENDRAKARQFIGILRGLALKRGCAVVLLAHPSLSGLNSGSGTSGSTGWNNSVRSRLYLERITQDGYEANPDARVLRTMKANYGRIGGEISMTWRDGVFVADAPETGLDRMATGMKAERVFLKMLRAHTEQGRRVNDKGGTSYAPKAFAEHPQAEGVTKRAFKSAMEALLADGKVRVAVDGPASRRVTYLTEASK